MNRHPALSLDLDDGIDRKVLGQLRQRFLAVNAGRLQRARQALSSRQERVLRLLPLLFHINHPLLPGYLSAKRAGQALGFGEYFVVRFETAQARWRAGDRKSVV